MQTHIRTIVVSYALRLVNENPNDRLVLGAGNFRVNQFDAVVDLHLLVYFVNAIGNRFFTHA
jgi:hypothetical protein